ncbi:MAG: TIM barrel protein [Gemmatimonadota bacterium]
MRLGGPVFGKWTSGVQWAALVRQSGYSAAYCPVGPEADDRTVEEYVRAAAAADIVVAEVGAWSNPISPRPEVRNPSLERCRRALQLADRIGARCCVNIAGSRLAGEGEGPTAPGWDGPDPGNLTEETFELIVTTVQQLIDTVAPTRTYYTLETMPWVYPDSAEAYEALIAAVDRERFAVHLDPVNLINSPQAYFRNAEVIRECFARLGPRIRSCHGKDILLSRRLTVHLDEVCPGDGGLDYAAYLGELDRLDPDTPLMLEHLASAEEYSRAAGHIRSVARESGLTFA